MKNVLSLTPGVFPLFLTRESLPEWGNTYGRETAFFFVKNTNLFVGVDFIYKHTFK